MASTSSGVNDTLNLLSSAKTKLMCCSESQAGTDSVEESCVMAAGSTPKTSPAITRISDRVSRVRLHLFRPLASPNAAR